MTVHTIGDVGGGTTNTSASVASGGASTAANVSSGGLVPDVMAAVGDFVGIFIGLGFIVIGIVILILSNEKVQDSARKVTGAAATLNPELAGVAVATSLATGRHARQENVTQAAQNARRGRKAAASGFKFTDVTKTIVPENKPMAGPKVKATPPPTPKGPTKYVKTDSGYSVPSSPRAEREFD